MGITSNEKSFPRGGKKPAVAVPRKGRFRLFDKPRTSSHSKRALKTRDKEHGTSAQLKLTHVEPLTLKTLSEGMLVLGCVSEVQEYNIVVSLPGRLIGHVPITSISSPYTKYLKDLVDGAAVQERISQLDEMFHIGQAVVTRVIEINRSSEYNAKVILSLVPDVVQSDWSPRSVTSGCVLIAAVKSQEENGYIMDTGIKNVRAFLKRSAALKYEKIWNQKRLLGVGHLMRCLVTKSSFMSFTATVELSADPKKVTKAVADLDDVTVDMLLPGTLLSVSVTKVLKNGLEVKFGKRLVGYIHKDHLTALWDTPEDYSIGDDLLARVLYVLPIVKFVYLSLKKELCDPEANCAPHDSLKVGNVRKAKIEHVDSCGITISIKMEADNLKGFVSIHHCSLHCSELDNNKSLKEQLSERFAVGTSHKCKVLAYDYVSQVFMCSLDKRIIKAKFLHPRDLHPGMVVPCEIKEHVQNGAFVVIDGGGKSLTGFVRSLHLGNVPLQHPEKKFPVGSQYSARVLLVQGNKIQLTLKPVLLASEVPPLSRFEDAQPGMLCEGVVTLVLKTGLLLTFYGNVKGWLRIKEDTEKKKYFIGQVVPCYVQTVDVTNGKLTLSLKQSSTADEKTSKKKKKATAVGKTYQLSVTNCTDVALEVESNSGSGTVPAQHLTDNPNLAQLLLRTYAPGDVIDDAVCFSEVDGLVFTVRPSLIEYFKSKGSAKRTQIREKMLLPCTVRSIMPKQVTLQLPLPGSNITHVKSKDMCSVSVKDATQLGLVDHQGLMSQVVKVYGSHECPRVTTKLSQCWDYSTEACVSLLCSFWRDYDKIAAHMKEQGNPLASLVPGDRVTGEVVAVENCGAVVRLENGIQGIATPKLYRGPLKCGAKVEGTVLFIDYLNQCVELTLCHGIMKRINTVQDGKLYSDLGVGTGVRGEVLSVRQEMIVIVLKGAGRKQLAYVPSRCHINDLVPDLQQYRIGETSKMIVQALDGGRIICLQQKFVFKLIKLKARAAVAAEWAKKKVGRTSQHQKSELSNGNMLGTSEQELNTGILPSVKRLEGAGYDSGGGSTNDDACVSEPENETKSGEESSDEDETAFLRRLEAKAMKNYYVNSASNEVQETSHNSDDYITEQKMKQKKRKMHEDGIIEDCEGTCKKKMRTTVQDELLKELKDIDHEGGCNSGMETLIQRKEVKELKNLDCGQAARLSVSAGFVWDADPSLLPAAAAAQKSDSSSDEEEVSKTEGKSKKLSRVERREQARQEEEHLRAIEQKLMDSETGPQSADDFDRLVLSSPNNSMCWIKYMAFHLQATEIEKARAIAHRALNTISFREEQEKLNVWCALLNLENLYGTKESLDKVLEEAVQMNDPFKVHTQMLQIYADSGKSEEAEKLVSLLTKKFRDNRQAWLQCGEVLLKLGKLEKARSLMQRAITNLDKKLHVEIISKFAHLENQLGEPERAQTLMEHILTSYPKRVDIWSSYVDMLVKNGQLEAARQVLERGVAQKLPARKMKSLFAKFLRFEEHHGTPEGMEKVRQMAVSYVETTAGRLDDDEN